MKDLQKYFLAIVPPQPFFDQVESLKEMIRQDFGSKYALKSPAHVTLKMPFSFSLKNEEKLKNKLEMFLANQKQFEIRIHHVDSFGKRVIFLKVEAPESLPHLQMDLKMYCQRELHLMPELSDRNYYPHMTVAFKDLKPSSFDGVFSLVREQKLNFRFSVEEVSLLKKVEGRWLKNHDFILLK
ncbi:2'-5' RNA ligase family protein [Algoriphagus hitonicola]|uniref:2'-5' RNA ligase n=1 Tax=Algoriphagus hitonicola TaxID=435880 RepID=A0A1I2QHW5_9BACT|nr:2'-5' RNA ligase family protein [Algoriphagus hitonicola]SFG27203.1 2'-5' RNA ligase [Algoriphagus hitonicola]